MEGVEGGEEREGEGVRESRTKGCCTGGSIEGEGVRLGKGRDDFRGGPGQKRGPRERNFHQWENWN